MIPDFNADGLLPSGKYLCTLEEIRERFIYNNKRKEIFYRLLKLIDVLHSVSCPTIYLDGSFVTAKINPSDVDVCWQEGTGTEYEYELTHAPVLNPTPANRVIHKNVFKADVFPADLMEYNTKKFFLDFFQDDKETGKRKGILMINLI